MQELAPVDQIGSRLGCQQPPTWYPSSHTVIRDFDSIGQNRPFLYCIPNPFPLYDWIMGFYERWSNRRLLGMIPLSTATRILELGTGTGFLLGEIIRRTNETQSVSAIDLSQQMLDITKKYLEDRALIADRLLLRRADCLELPFDDRSFDLCLSSYLLDLLPEDEIPQALTEIERVLAPGGHAFLLTVTTEFHDTSKVRETLERVANECYCCGYRQGLWNPIWRALFSGYAPHCRPISLGRYLQAHPTLTVQATRITHVSLLPARIYHVQKCVE